MTDEEYKVLQAKLRPRLTDEFLATLVEAARVDGDSDWNETQSFIQNVFEMAGKDVPLIDPYKPISLPD